MFTRPADVPDSDIALALHDGWAVTADGIAYSPVGFGSHHWRVAARHVEHLRRHVDTDDPSRGTHDLRGDEADLPRAAAEVQDDLPLA